MKLLFFRRVQRSLLISLLLGLLALSACAPLPPIEPYPYPIPENPRDNETPDRNGNNPYPPAPDRPNYPDNTDDPNSSQSGGYPPSGNTTGSYPNYPTYPDAPDPIPSKVDEPESKNQAVIALVKESETLQADGDFSKAGSQLERALRIEPRNPWLVYRLATIRLEQGEAKQAEAFARKSIRLAELSNFHAYTKRKLKYQNWQLIADARRQLGDGSGAREAQSRSRDYVI